MGPTRAVDAAAVFAAIDTARRPVWVSRSVPGAIAFLVAGAFVALFGGLLLTSVLTTRPDEMVPAVVTVSPSPVATDDLLSRLVTEEVEPGVYRVLDDGAGHRLTSTGPGDLGSRFVAAGPDGSVWLSDAERVDGSAETFRLGLRGSDRLRAHGYWPDLTVAADGTVWAAGRGATRWPATESGVQLLSYQAGRRAVIEVPDRFQLVGLEVGEDGSLLVNGVRPPFRDWTSCDPVGGRPVVARLADGEWTMLPDVPSQVTSAGDGGSLAWSPDGSVWLAVDAYNTCVSWVGLLRFDGVAWSVVPEVPSAEYAEGRPAAAWEWADGTSVARVGPVVAGPDGTVWVYGADPSGQWLMRYAGEAWTRFGVTDDVPMLVDFETWRTQMDVGPDGTRWIARANAVPDVAELSGASCGGVFSFDGRAWTTYLDGYCAADVAVGPDGRVWATVTDLGYRWPEDDVPADLPDRAGLYVIDPAVAAAE